MRGKSIKLSVLIISISMLATLIAVSSPQASAVPTTTLTISDPKFGDSPVYVCFDTLFTLSVSETSNIYFKWGTNDYVQYTIPFYAEIEAVASTPGGPPGFNDTLEGLQTLYYNATGESQKSIQVFVDDFYPTTVANIIGANHTGDKKYISPDSGIALSSADQGSGVANTFYRVDNGTVITYNTPFKLSPAGERTITYYSADNLGNREPDKILKVFVDDQPPAVSIVPGPLQVTVSGNLYLGPATQVSLTAMDISGISSSSYRIDGGTWTPYSTPFSIQSGGQHTIAARATDNLGQSSAEASLTVHIDSTPPEAFVVDQDSAGFEMKSGSAVEL
ncbi:MAG: hypothetical protein R6W91_07965, partial [Thermoplasmata archaeon]